MNFWIDLTTKDFLQALRTVKPKLRSTAKKAGTLDISLINGEAVFCVAGAITRIPANGHWAGLVELPILTMLSFIQVPPPGEVVRLEFDGEKVKIGSFRCKANWQKVSQQVAEIKNSIHMNELDKNTDSVRRYCPECGSKTGRQKKSPTTDLLGGGLLEQGGLNYECNKCGLEWNEMKSLRSH